VTRDATQPEQRAKYPGDPSEPAEIDQVSSSRDDGHAGASHPAATELANQAQDGVLLEALAEVDLSGYERRCLTRVAAWETHMVATLAALMSRSYAAGVQAARERNCNDADREQAS
jgi:hypothetical protein